MCADAFNTHETDRAGVPLLDFEHPPQVSAAIRTAARGRSFTEVVNLN
jgi:hypothetical protein